MVDESKKGGAKGVHGARARKERGFLERHDHHYGGRDRQAVEAGSHRERGWRAPGRSERLGQR